MKNYGKNLSSIKEIKILGLFGKENYTFNLDNGVNIFIGENGLGKTTILKIIYYFLTGKKRELEKLPFYSVKIYFNKNQKKMEYTNKKNKEFKEKLPIIMENLKGDLPNLLYSKIEKGLNDLKVISEEDFRILINSILGTNLFNYEENEKLKFSDFLLDKLEENKKFKEKVLFFPTYRRIENNYKIPSGYENIKFDMNDIEEIIEQYIEKSKNELLNLNYSILKANKFKEIEDYLSEWTNLQERNKNRLNNYIDICNRYLINKKMEYNETTLKVSIINQYNELINFNSLSSGEKQIISLLTITYLSLKEKVIFIIDEPELSLSIEWQEMLLKDLYDSNKISLMIVATHSPFIFQEYFFENTKSIEDLKG